MANSKVNSVMAESFNAICVAVASPDLGTGVKVYSMHPTRDGLISVSVPVTVRRDWKVGEKKELSCHFSKDKRFLVAECGNGSKGKSTGRAEKEAFELLTAK